MNSFEFPIAHWSKSDGRRTQSFTKYMVTLKLFFKSNIVIKITNDKFYNRKTGTALSIYYVMGAVEII